VTQHLDIVTVACLRDLNALKMQAKSISLYFKAEDIGKILIIANGPNSQAFKEIVTAQVVGSYGCLSSRVQVVDGEELYKLGTQQSGWTSQQLFKLLAAKLVSADHYLVIDSKNHFVNAVSGTDFIDADGRMRMTSQSNAHSLSDLFRNSYKYFSLDPERWINDALPQTTPFMINTADALEMMSLVEVIEQKPFGHFFFSTYWNEKRVSEFFLISAYTVLKYAGFDKIYHFVPPISEIIFGDKANAHLIDLSLRRIRSGETKLWALHHLAKAHLGPEVRGTIGQLWLERGLIAEAAQADDYLT
jgi:hypothetical protein